ncbi:class I SAM-dependent methyltransferase [bacterium]|nr:class I SAM-dependent methyltransferase [bacterium]
MKNLIAYKIENRKKIHPSFKKLIRDSRAGLLDLKQKIDAADKKRVSFTSLVKRFYKPLEELQTHLLKESDILAENFSPEEHLYHKDFFRDQMGPLLWYAPFYERIFLKPLGYAGDYEMMNMLYDSNPFKGPSAYFKMINAFGCRCISGQLTVARIPYFLEKFKEIGKNVLGRKKDFTILDLACGPSREIKEFILTNTDAGKSRFHLVDQDPEAIKFSKNELIAAKRKKKSKVNFSFYNKPIQEFLAGGIQDLPQFDFIYSCGLFDYLDDTLFEMAVDVLYHRLAEQGTLIIGNVSPDDYSKTLKWYLGDWPLIYRNRDDLLKIASHLPAATPVCVESEATGLNLFLKITK